MRNSLALVALAVAAIGCSKQQPTTETSLSPSVQIVVNNNFVPPGQVTVYIVNASGFKSTLGNVSPGQKITFKYSPTNATDRFTLVAQSNGGKRLTSQQFTLINASQISWDMSSNLMQTFEN